MKGWLDTFKSGGKMQEYQPNVNNSSVSIPKDFVGLGYNTKGRNYSPAWGGQFKEGGEIPMAQNGWLEKIDNINVGSYEDWIDYSDHMPLIVNFGYEYNDDNEEILILPQEAYKLNVAQYIYELIVKTTPAKKVHPKVLDGTMESEALKKLEELKIKESKTVETDNESTDPRWDKLKDLLTGKNT